MTPRLSRESPQRFRMLTAPENGFEPQIGWVYERRPLRKRNWVKLRLVELPSKRPSATVLDITLPIGDLDKHFEEVTS